MKIKVCGMRNANNISALLQVGVDYLGFIFYDKSKRFVADFPDTEIPSTTKKIGVFVNEALDSVMNIVSNNKLDGIQLHGEESVGYCEKLKEKFNDTCIIIKAFSVDDAFVFSDVTPYESVCDIVLFDTKGKYHGGNGYKFNWDVLLNYKGNTPYLLSGGISLDDASLVKTFMQSKAAEKCLGVDLNSGFEIEPGLKNIEDLKEFKKEILA